MVTPGPDRKPERAPIASAVVSTARRSGAVLAGFLLIWLLLQVAVLDPPVVIAATMLAIATSFPLAHMFEHGANTLWAPALVHAVIQSIKLVRFPEEFAISSALAWMAACAVIPYLAFAFRERDTGATVRQTAEVRPAEAYQGGAVER